MSIAKDVRTILNKAATEISSQMVAKDWSLGLLGLDPVRVG